MKKRILLLFIIVLYCFRVNAQQENRPEKFTLTGKITGRDTGLVWLSYSDKNGKDIKDTTYLKNGNFSFSGFINEPTRALIGGLNKSMHADDPNIRFLYIEPSSMQIRLKENDFMDAEIMGSKTQREKDTLTAQPIAKKFAAIYLEFGDIDKKIKQGDTSAALKNKWQAIRNTELIYWQQKKEIEYAFIISHPKSYLSPSFALYYFHVKQLSLDSARLLYNSLDPRVKQSQDGKYLDSLIKAKTTTSIGGIAPLFTKADMNGKEVDLAAFKGKSYVLIDFWASWCVPCRELTPYLKSIYTQYNLKGFDVISVAIHNSEKDWKKAIKDDNMMKWNNIRDNDEITALKTEYGIGAIPAYILIDKNGIIVGRYMGEEKEGIEALNEKLKEIFN